MEGWVRLHRKIRQNPIFNDMELYRLWMICLTEATYKERDQLIGRQTVHLMPGQFVTGRFDLQSMYNNGLKVDQQKSPKTLWRWLEALENGEFLTINSTNKYSVVSILNWSLYQSDDQQNDQQVTNKRPTDDQQVTTNKKVKKDNKDKKEKNKTLYAPGVALAEDEHQKLCDEYGEEITAASISYLDSYKIEKNYKTKSDYMTIRRWVVDAVKKKVVVIGGGQGGKYGRSAQGNVEENRRLADKDSDLNEFSTEGFWLRQM